MAERMSIVERSSPAELRIARASAVLPWVLAACLIAAAGCSVDTISGSDGDRDERYETSLADSTAAAGLASLSVETENGRIEVTASSGDWVQIRVHTQVRAPSLERAEDFASQVAVEVERDGDELRLYHEHPHPPNDIQVIVDYEVECPPQLVASLVGVNGDIDVEGLTAATSIVLVNGDVDFRGSLGPLSVVSVNGGISATIRDLASAASFVTVNGTVDITVPSGVGSLSVQATNGTVAVHLHEGFDAQLDARVSLGRIRSDVQLSAAQVTETRLRGTIGTGGDAEVAVQVTNGTIEIDTL